MPACRIAFALVFLFCGASATWAALPAWLAPITETAEPFIGVTHYQITQSLGSPQPYVLPREISIHIVEIDPDAPGVSFLGTPGNGSLPEEFTRRRTSSFLAAHDLAMAINGDFYTTNTGAYASVSGLAMSDGAVTSAGASGRPSFVTREDDSATVRSNGSIPSGAENAVSGNQRLIRNGVNVTPSGSYTTTLNPHSAIGVDEANGHIFLMTVDGRQTNFSEGMRTDEMAEMLLDFGVDEAINLDGGGSTTLVFGDGPRGAPRVVNSPSDGSTSQRPGNERSVANHFGVFATPNPGYTPLAPPHRPVENPDPADFDRDAGANLSDWRGDFGENAFSDADGDGDTDGADFLAWQRQLGGTSAVRTATAVPEPAALGLGLIGMLAGAGLPRRAAPTQVSEGDSPGRDGPAL